MTEKKYISPILDSIRKQNFESDLELAHNLTVKYINEVDNMRVSPDEAAVKNLSATLTVVKHEILVKCLPMEIPHEIKVDVSKLENAGDSIHVSDLDLGKGIEIMDEPGDTIVSVYIAKEEDFAERTVEVPEELKAEPVKAEEGEKKEEKK